MAYHLSKDGNAIAAAESLFTLLAEHPDAFQIINPESRFSVGVENGALTIGTNEGQKGLVPGYTVKWIEE